MATQDTAVYGSGLSDDRDNRVSEDLVREHAEGWNAFTKFLTYSTSAVITVLVLMAIFLL